MSKCRRVRRHTVNLHLMMGSALLPIRNNIFVFRFKLQATPILKN